jgi:RND family efflux transporter MFP subunit
MTNEPASKRRYFIIGGASLLFLAVVVWRVLQATATQDAAPTVEQIRTERGVPVTVAAVERAALSIWEEFSGSVTGTRDAVVLARADDRISEVLVQVGDRVHRGQVLVRVANESVAARVRQARAALTQAERGAERAKALLDAGAISDQAYEQATTQLELARADLAAASDPVTITSPLDGTVTEVIARAGMIPRNGDPLVRVADLTESIVRLRLSAGEVARLRVNQPARVVGSGTQGQVRRVALQADPTTRLVEVQVVFPPGARLITGTLATIEVETTRRAEAVQVPRAAIRDGSVWVVNAEGLASRRIVQVGMQSADVSEILGGLEAGERVVVEGGSLLSEGARTRIVTAEGR